MDDNQLSDSVYEAEIANALRRLLSDLKWPLLVFVIGFVVWIVYSLMM
jgi:hypothetical protein